MNQIRKRLTYANVMSSIAVFLVLGGGAAIAAKNVLPKNSVGPKQLKKNAVTAKKIKKNAVTTAKVRKNAIVGAKIKDGTIGGAKIADGSITGADVNTSTLGTVPNSADTDVIKKSQGTIPGGGQATVFAYGPFKIVIKCELIGGTQLRGHGYIESSASGSVFTSWQDGSKDLGPSTPESEREINNPTWGGGNAEFAYDSASDLGVSATAPTGESFTSFTGWAGSADSNTCWYWSTATIIS